MPGVNATGLIVCQQIVLRQTELLNADLNRRVVLRSHVRNVHHRLKVAQLFQPSRQLRYVRPPKKKENK